MTETTAIILIRDLRERGRHGEEEWTAYRDQCEELLRILRHEPRCFGDTYLMALLNEGWTMEEAVPLLRRLEEMPSIDIREALEAEWREAVEWIEDAKR